VPIFWRQNSLRKLNCLRCWRPAESAGTIILPMIVSPCRFQQTPSLSQFQAVNLPKHPLNAMSKTDQEEVFVRVAESVEKALKS
jgi:hypothetical protein